MKANAHLSEELRKEHNRRAFPVKKGDKVRVKVGSFKGTIGKVVDVDRARGFARIENAERKKSDGSKLKVKIHTSNLELIEIDLSDKWRKKIIKRTYVKKEVNS